MKKGEEINLLAISLSLGIGERRGDGSLSDQQLNQLKYAQGFSSSHIIVKTPKDSRYQPFSLSDKVRIYPTQSRNRYTFLMDSWRLGKRIIREYPINLITTQDPFGTGLIGYFLSRKYRIPLCVHNVCDFIDNPWWIRERKVNYVLNFFGKKILFKADSIRVDNNDEREKLMNLKIPSEKIWNIPFIVNDARKFINCKEGRVLREKLLGKEYEKIVLFIGRFEKQKDLPTFFRAARLVLEDFCRTLFLVVGTGKEETKVKRLVEDLNIKKNVLFVGWIDYFDLPKYYAICDAFVLTSKYETSPRVLIFACLCRKPIVSTDVSGAKELVESGKNGFIVPVVDERGLAEGILNILKDPERSREMGEYGFKKVEVLLDEEKLLQENQKMYEFTLKPLDHSK